MLELDSNSELLNVLCNDSGNGCEFPAVVTLNTNLNCVGVECEVDDMRLIKVASNPDVHYEYVRLPCVEQTFYENSLTVQNAWPRISMCANGDLSVAQEACCEWPTWTDPGAVTDCRYSVEKTKFSTSAQRCAARFPSQGEQCMWTWYHANFTFDGGLTYQNGECHWGYDVSILKFIENYVSLIENYLIFLVPNRTITSGLLLMNVSWKQKFQELERLLKSTIQTFLQAQILPILILTSTWV